MSTAPKPPGGKPDLLTTRALLLITVAVIAGAAVGLLTYAAGPNLPAAVLAGLTAAGATLFGLHTLTGN